MRKFLVAFGFLALAPAVAHAEGHAKCTLINAFGQPSAALIEDAQIGTWLRFATKINPWQNAQPHCEAFNSQSALVSAPVAVQFYWHFHLQYGSGLHLIETPPDQRSCAILSRQMYNIISDPQNAAVPLNDRIVGVSPCYESDNASN
jgi:hypothetical protein